MNDEHAALLAHLHSVSEAMDTQFRVLGFPVGIDAIIGLIPGLGDILGGLISLYIIYRARSFEFADEVYNKMLVNVVIDVFVGSIPLIGDLFDFFFKVNERNMRLIESHLS